ncbi:hypothetical protein DPMN_093902 [Dreissena polymorpha]|uniref:THD domain-containing protein n=2 Tax=Dreissena polymorpha TaxID=45954 RepID=A0A9D4L4F3_DREPO|nr:hypothetical protein DPMN_093902 [Dreissena polymorpha]
MRANANTSLLQGSNVCVPCRDLLWERERDEAIEDRVANLRTDAKDACCGETADIISLMNIANVKSIFFKNAIGSPLGMFYLACGKDNLYSLSLPEAKVVGVVDFLPTNGDFHRVLWNKNGRTTTKGGLMHLELEGELFIRRPGKYFVYVNLQLMSNQSGIVTSDDHVIVTLKLSVLSHHYGYARTVSEETQSSYRMSNFTKSRKFGALFDFHEYDRISVLISHPELIGLNVSDNYMYAIYQE